MNLQESENPTPQNKEVKKNWFARHKIITGILVIFVVAAVASSAGSKKDDTSNAKTTQAKQQAVKTKAEPGINSVVRDGKFEFTVTKVDCGQTTVGTNQYLTKTAQGQYCLLSLTVKNIGNESQSLFSSNQKLLNSAGQKYSADDTATVYLDPSGSSWYNNINPGNTVTGQIAFDLPKGQTPTKAELHDSAYSNGITVKLN